MTMSKSFQPPFRLLLGPGPSNVEDRVLRAMSAQVVGYFDPFMTEITGEIGRLLRLAFGTANRATFPISGTGTSGMEAALVNLLDPGDKCVIAHNGFFGDRLVQIAERCGGVPVPFAGEWGRPIFAEQVEAAVTRAGTVKAIAVPNPFSARPIWIWANSTKQRVDWQMPEHVFPRRYNPLKSAKPMFI